MSNSHCRRDKTVEFRRVGVGIGSANWTSDDAKLVPAKSLELNMIGIFFDSSVGSRHQFTPWTPTQRDGLVASTRRWRCEVGIRRNVAEVAVRHYDQLNQAILLDLRQRFTGQHLIMKCVMD